MQRLARTVCTALSLFACASLIPACAAETPESKTDKTMKPEVIASGSIWKADDTIFGDGRPAPTPGPKHKPHGFQVSYNITVPDEGWYELFFKEVDGNLGHDLVIDGALRYFNRATDSADKDGYAKVSNLWLTKGKHVLKIKRTGRNSFPMKIFETFELRKADAGAVNVIFAEKTGNDVVRCGEPFTLSVYAGGDNAAHTYEFIQSDITLPLGKERESKSKTVATLSVPAHATMKKFTVKIPSPAEGIFELTATVNGQKLPASSFARCIYCAVDTKAKDSQTDSNAKMQLIHDIDCVAQTDAGKSIDPATFIECNGPTRISTGAGVQYRESHDCTPPEAEIPTNPSAKPRSYSGFAYRFTVPQKQVPYLIEVEYPDDARRSASICLNWLDADGTLNRSNEGYQGKSYETGGFFPITNKTYVMRKLFWPLTESGVISILSQQKGQRAAISRIKISRFDGDVIPLEAAPNRNGRTYSNWYEEIDNWRVMVGSKHLYPDYSASNFAGMQRWIQMVRYYGGNAIGGMGASYQTAFWNSMILEGMEYKDYNFSRLACLLCEKFGMKYVPEIFNNQWYLNKVTLPRMAENPQDVRSMNCNGGENGRGSSPCDLNPLHPAVQDTFIAALGELADTLRDSPAFLGISTRADGWMFRGDFFYPSIHWGYGDWTIQEFEKDTGLHVPGGPSDANAIKELGANNPQLYPKRFIYLNSPQVKDKWTSWRCNRIEDYNTRLLERIRGNRKDIFFAIVGSFDSDKELYESSDRISERALGCGIELKKRSTSDGLAVFATARYGCRETGLTEREIYDGFFDKENVQAGMCSPRGFASYMTYHELNTTWPADLLGIKMKNNEKPPYYCSAVLAAGRNCLEKYAVVLAEQDTAYLSEGGNADSFGDPEIIKPWMKEYTALPALPFEKAAGSNDPVAVWYRTVNKAEAKTLGMQAGLYFYAVNRERIPVSAKIMLPKAAGIKYLTSDKAVTADNNKLELTLDAFELVSFIAPISTTIESAESEISPEMQEYLYNRLAYAQQLKEELTGEQFSTALDEKQFAAYNRTLDTAWTALKENKPWRARVELDMVAMMRANLKTGKLPAGELETTFPDLLTDPGTNGHWNLTEPIIPAKDLAEKIVNTAECKLIDSATVNESWRGYQVLWSDKGTIEFTMDIPALGDYMLTLGQIADQQQAAIASVNGTSLPTPVVIGQNKTPLTMVLPTLHLEPGTVTIRLQGNGGIGIYAVRFLPVLRPIPGKDWKVAGPFPSPWGGFNGHDVKLVKQALEADYPAMTALSDDATFKTSDGKTLGWAFALDGVNSCLADRGVMMPLRTYAAAGGVNIAVTRIHSETDRTALLYLAVDWWARAYLNGERLSTNINKKEFESSGADFNTHYPIYFSTINLKKGENVLVVKQQGGSLGSALTGFITDHPSITTHAHE